MFCDAFLLFKDLFNEGREAEGGRERERARGLDDLLALRS